MKYIFIKYINKKNFYLWYFVCKYLRLLNSRSIIFYIKCYDILENIISFKGVFYIDKIFNIWGRYSNVCFGRVIKIWKIKLI